MKGKRVGRVVATLKKYFGCCQKKQLLTPRTLISDCFYWSKFSHLPSPSITSKRHAISSGTKRLVSASGGWRPPVRATRNQPPQAIHNEPPWFFPYFFCWQNWLKNHSIYNFKHIFYDGTKCSILLLTSNSLEISKSSWYHQHSPHNISQNEFSPGPAPFPLQFLNFCTTPSF